MKPPRIYRALNLIAADVAATGIPKLRTNADDQYQYRSIDDILGCLAPVLARRRVCVLPRVIERTAADRPATGDHLLVSVSLKVAFDLVSAMDGSAHTVESYGEALDAGDKATAKAMSAAFKSAMIQTFCIPVANLDADSASPKLKRVVHESEPPEGWQTWTESIVEMIRSCESEEAGNRVLATYRSLLVGLNREQRDLYASVGAAFSELRKRQFRGSAPNVNAARLNGKSQSEPMRREIEAPCA